MPITETKRGDFIEKHPRCLMCQKRPRSEGTNFCRVCRNWQQENAELYAAQLVDMRRQCAPKGIPKEQGGFDFGD